jgi:hypothetical protein
MIKMLQDHFDSHTEDKEQNQPETDAKYDKGLNDSEILDDRRVLFDSAIRRQLESSPNFEN